MRWKPYPQYRPSDVKWMGDVPEHWAVKRLKQVASVQFSNVDKHTIDGEEPVRLCNYVDVYYNDFITDNLDLMAATATRSEIAKFQVRQGDVLVTKDSESWDDIAVPAYVATNLDGVLCGYHLAQIRPDPGRVYGKYLFRAFRARGINDQFRVAANGITRFGLGNYWLANGLFPIPQLKEQRAIATFLDRETGRIDGLIAKKQRQIELLAEKRAALISHAVTKGLDPNVKMKDSGIEWLGQIPEHWTSKKLKFLTRQIIDGAHFTPTYVDDGVPFLRVTDIHTGDIDFNAVKRIPLQEHRELIKRCHPKKGDLLLSKNGTIGVPCVINWDEEFSIFVSLCLIKVTYDLDVSYAKYFFLSKEIEEQMNAGGKTNTITNLHLDKIREFVFAVPPVEEQAAISSFLDQKTRTVDSLIRTIRDSADKLREYRTALISAAVTGKIDVREEVAS